ncbi:MAG: hypothetical protein Q9168_007212 [Polycauliona sp. 1 TL-2023]
MIMQGTIVRPSKGDMREPEILLSKFCRNYNNFNGGGEVAQVVVRGYLLEIIHRKVQHHVSQLVPSVEIQFHPPPPRYNGTKIALLIEDRPIQHLTPLLLHTIYVLPPDWQLLYLGSAENLVQINRSIAIQHYQENGKIELRLAPRNSSYDAREQRNRILTDIAFYKEYVPRAEWLLMHHADSVLCANSPHDLNDWLEYDWVGAPWYNYNNWNGGGGLSLRRMSRIQQVLGFQSRQDDLEPEDKWFSDRVKLLPNVKLPKSEAEKKFAVEGIWDAKPMGIHVPSSDNVLLRDAWDDPGKRKQMLEYCPEIKMIMAMKLERERCEEETIVDPAEAARQAEAAKQAEEQKAIDAERLAEAEKAKEAEKLAVAAKAKEEKQKEEEIEAEEETGETEEEETEEEKQPGPEGAA